MAIETINNGESGKVVRDKINGNFGQSLNLDPTDGLQIGGAAPNAEQRAAVRAGIDELAFRPRTLPEFIASYGGFSGLPSAVLGNSIVAAVSGGNFLQKFIHSYSNLVLATSAGIASNTSQQMLDRIDTDIPDSTKVCFFMEGPNDAVAGVTPQQHAANYRDICLNLLGRGILPVMVISPPNSAKPAAMEAYRLAEFLVAREFGISAYDPWTAYVDPATGGWLAGSNVDPTHPNAATHAGAALKMRALVDGTDDKQVIGPRSNVSGTASVCLSGGNNYLLTDTNADGTADGWTKVGVSGVASLVDATAGFFGKFQKLANNSGTGEPYMRKIITTGYAIGDRLLMSCVVEAVASSDNGQVHVQFKHSGVVGSVIWNVVESLTARRVFFEFSPTTLDSIEFYFKINGAGIGQYIAFGEFEVYNLTAGTAVA